jgi:AcrR family transcriptional regulator
MARTRRTAEDARAQILKAAEKRLLEAGPASIRLQEIAGDLGVSHQAILHHFKSREGLVEAVVKRALDALQADLVAAFMASMESGAGAPDGAVLLERVAETFATRGHARLIAWLVLSGNGRALETQSSRASWRAILDATHALRESGGAGGSFDDTRFTVLLSLFALFGHAILGEQAFRLAGLGEAPNAHESFRNWLAGVLVSRLET